jgi:vitamin B12 transporter
MIRISFLFLLAALPLLPNPLKVQGVVVDPSSRPVPNATVECAGRRSVTNAEGRFTLELNAPCEATIASGGFETARATLEPGREMRISLTLARLSERVVVSATRTPTTIEASGVSASVFTRQDLVERQLPAVADLLREVPGAGIVDTGRRGAVTSLFMRGGQSTATLFLLDGVPLNEPGGQLDLSGLTTAGVDRVEVVRGAESALFGADAASGVVQLFTARGDPEARMPHGWLSYERGNFQTDHWAANLNGGLADRIDYSLTADQFHDAGMFPNDFYRNTTGTANIGFRLTSATQLRAVYREYDSVTGNPGQVGFGERNLDAYGSNRQSTLSVRLDDVRSPHFVQLFSVGYNRFRNLFEDSGNSPMISVAALVQDVSTPTPRVYLVQQVSPDFPASSVPAGLRLVTGGFYPYPSSFVGVDDRTMADYQGTWTHRGGALVFGYRYERQTGLISNVNVDRTNNGGFFHEQYTIGRRLFLTGGARLENSTTFGSRFVPRGSATFQLFKSTFLRASGGRGFTEPTLLENFANESYYVGNPRLKPEKTTMFDAGIVQELFNRRVRLEGTYFRNAFEDLIVFDSTNYPSTWNNIDRSWARGLEASATVKVWKYVQVAANYTHMRTRITSTVSTSPYTGVGQELPRRPTNSGSAWVSVTPRRWSLIAGGRAVGERQDSDYTFGVTRNPGYGTMFLSGSYAANKHFTPYLRIDNLLNERYEEVLGYTALTRSAIGGVRVAW